MKLVIDISENLYNFVNTKRPNGYYNEFDKFDTYDVSKAIRNGIPLPKGHGRLKDVDWIDDNCENHHSDKDGSWCYAWRDIDNAPTIIEADKIESEE